MAKKLPIAPVAKPCAQKLKVLADSTRLGVIELLMQGPLHVNDLVRELGVEQSLLSHHLQTLRDSELVEAQRDGRGVLYRLSRRHSVTASGAIDLGCCRITFR